MTDLLTCRDLSIRAGARLVVDRFSWAHSPPGVVWVTGSNGSGKSLLLQVVAGWRKPHAGGVRWLHGRPRELRYLTPAMTAPPALRVGDFVSFVLRHAQPGSAALDALYPPHVTAGAAFGKLSTGEAKRLLLWALLSHGNGPLILDEPYEHLARDAKASLTAVLRERAVTRLVLVATNQEVAAGDSDTQLHVDDAGIEVTHGR